MGFENREGRCPCEAVMRIGLISPYTNPCPPVGYGGETYFWGLADTLGEMGHEVHLFAPRGSKTPTKGFLHIISSTERGVIRYDYEVRMEEEYHSLLMAMDIVHDCSYDHIAAERLWHLYGKRNIVNTINGRCYYMPRPPFNVVTGSKAWQKDAEEHGLKTEMVYWGIDTSFYTPVDDIRGDYYLWLARFHPDKGLDLALDLAEELGFNLKVAGSMEFKDHEVYGKEYLRRIEGLPNVEYVPLPLDETHHERKRELYRHARAFLYPVNYFECFGMVVVEAMACGCPVITSDKGAMPELVRGGEDGFICKGKEEFKAAIEQWDLWPLGDPRRKALMFSWQDAARGYEKLYQKVLEGYSW